MSGTAWTECVVDKKVSFCMAEMCCMSVSVWLESAVVKMVSFSMPEICFGQNGYF
jgi:hypothetical protein